MLMNDKNIRNKFLPFHRPEISEEEIQEVVDTLKNGWITTGPKAKLFEERFKQYIGAKYAIALNSCTAGLHLSLVAAGIGEGDEVITTPLTFAATGQVIMQVGAKPVFVDIEKDGFNIDHTLIEQAITPKTRAIIPVHFGGLPCDMDEIIHIAKTHNLFVIEDAAHALGAKYHQQTIGTIGDVTVFSFYANKNITTGEGGMVTTNNKKLAESIRILSLHGMSRDAWKRYSKEGSWYYEIIASGYKYNFSDILASIGLHQLEKIERFQKNREEYANIYNEEFRKIDELEINISQNGHQNAWHLYVIKLKLNLLKINRNEFIHELKAMNIGTSVHFIPLHLHPYYRENFGFKHGDLPNSEKIYQRIISLPLYPSMTLNDIQYVINSVKKIITKFRKNGG